MILKKITYIVVLGLSCIAIAIPPVLGEDTAAGQEAYEEETGPLAVALTIFRKTISRADGRRCMMYPSCSHYSGQAFRKHGFVKGWVMSSDRLLRCGRDEKHLSEEIIINKQVYVFDPLQHNDFWWSRP